MTAWLLGGPVGAGASLEWAAGPREVAALVAAGALAVLLAALTSRARPAPRALEALLWGLAVAVLVAAAAGPRLVREGGRESPGRIVVLVDTSASMSVREGGRTRAELALDRLAELRRAAGDRVIEAWRFDEDLRAGAPSGPGDFAGRGTNLGLALDRVADRFLGRRLAGVVVLTDGIDRGGLRAALAEESAGADLPALPGPLTLVVVGSGEELRDVAVTKVAHGDFAFLRTPFELRAELRGPPGVTLPVTLAREGRLVARRRVTLDDQGRGEATFEVVPRRVGRFVWDVSVPVDADDVVPGNNAWPVVVRVVRDRTRVLQVCGAPSYDQKFLRLFLKEDPSVDLVSFFILRRDEDFAAGWRPDELSLISFPYRELFGENIDSFDVIVFQDFDWRPYFLFGAADTLENIARWVRNGGALAMVGGETAFDGGAWAGTPVADVLPVLLGVDGPATDEEPFRPVLTEAGRRHPVTRLAATAEETVAAWVRLPELDGLNRTVGPAPGAAVLLAHPRLRAERGGRMPVLAVREVGRGRSLALMVDSSWRWSFSEVAEGRGNQAYLRFWKNALRWLVGEADTRRLVVAPSRDNVLVGDEVRIVVDVRDEGFEPRVGVAVRGTVRAPSGAERTFEATTDEAGQAVVALRPEEPGAHRVEVRADGAGRAETVFAATRRDPELSEIAPDAAFLAALAARYGERARLVRPGEPLRPLLDPEAREVVREREVTPLGAAPAVPLAFGLLASAAWVLRRRGGAP